jgi:hypothetical protein
MGAGWVSSTVGVVVLETTMSEMLAVIVEWKEQQLTTWGKIVQFSDEMFVGVRGAVWGTLDKGNRLTELNQCKN